MVDSYAFDYFLAGDLAELPPAVDRHPRRKVGNRSDDFDGIAGAEREVLHALMNENSLEGIDLVGIKSCKRQNSQAQSIESFSFRTGETSTLVPTWWKPSRTCFPKSGTCLNSQNFACTLKEAAALQLSEKVNEKRPYG